MRVSKHYLGKMVEVVWRDPCSAHVTALQEDLSDLPKGRGVLATQVERGVIMDLTEGVLRIHHNEGRDPRHVTEPTTDVYATWLPEELVETIRVFVPEGDIQGEPPKV